MFVRVCSEVVTAPAGTSAKAAQEVLRANKKGRLPIVNAAGELVSSSALAAPLAALLQSCS